MTKPFELTDGARFVVMLTAGLLAVIAGAAPVSARPHYPEPFVSDQKLDRLQRKVSAPGAAIANGCRTPSADADPCRATSLDRARAKMAALRKDGGRAEDGRTVRFLHLGDSHVAADYITSRIRKDLQAEYGDGGRGFMHPDQRWGYGGRRVGKTKDGWIRDRIVDGGRAGRPYGMSGNSLTAKRKGVSVAYRVLPGDHTVRIYVGQKRGRIYVLLDKKPLGGFKLSAERPYVEIALPPRKPRTYSKGPPGNTLWVRADNQGIALYGIAFDSGRSGVQYSSIGPVGADAKVYLQLDRDSFAGHLRAYQPDVVVYMVGGNDALKIRKRWTTLARVERDHQRLIRRVRRAVPESECIMWAPLLAGQRRKGRVVSKRYLAEVRAMQRRVAAEEGCAFWDAMAAMGGPKNTARWVPALADDLVHPRKSAADLIGRMFVQAWSTLD